MNHTAEQPGLGPNVDEELPIAQLSVADDPVRDDNSDNGSADVNEEAKVNETASKKKKKRGKGKSAAKRGPTALPKGRGTGFEEYFADPPMTPQESMEEKMEVYSSRIQACIQRFRSRRRLTGRLTLYFNEYLFLGGINTNSNAYTGQDPRELKAMTPAQRREATAADAVHRTGSDEGRFYNGDEKNWSVDFYGVAAGYFSTAVPLLTGMVDAEFEQAVDVVKNFLRYVLHHDVCPEYEADVKKALELCGVVYEEWARSQELLVTLPGAFNKAACLTYGISQHPDYPGRDHIWNSSVPFRVAFYSTLGLLGEPALLRHLSEAGTGIVKEFDCVLKVVEITRPSIEQVARFEHLHIGNQHRPLHPVGKVVLVPSTIEDDWDYPAVPSQLDKGERVTLYLEDAILANLQLGVKLSVHLMETTTGFRFIYAVDNVVPSFYTFLPQSMMKHFRQLELNERPAPSVACPEADDGQMDDNI
ncbi:Argonaute siRNA chaperone complex subunit Arb1-domain-containing protein [Stachybotrys elegans]|uniref:Argonaute siRNA chaperone complex subunit Arb1-domain-containing protein n=1 Tax=Stachybotrys elegans TaxID=80388 RepID=A0A8K0WV46_9HYPO|nr:Argonaute siRNA chaperone complex subunit Arb1-domain-containing protein [Stachybotrys elegans]